MKLYLVEHVDDFDVQYIVAAENKKDAVRKIKRLVNSYEKLEIYYTTDEEVRDCYAFIEFEGDVIQYDNEMHTGHIIVEAEYGRFRGEE